MACRTRTDPGAHGPAAEAERLAREAVDLAAPTDFLDLQATALLALARVLQQGGSPEAATVAAEAQAVYERKGNIVGAGRAALLLGSSADDGVGSPRGGEGGAA